MIASLVEVWSHRERMAKSPEQVPGLLWMRWRIVGIYPYEVEDNQLGFQLKALGRVWRFRWGLSCHCFLQWLTKPISNHLTCLLLPTFTFRTAFFPSSNRHRKCGLRHQFLLPSQSREFSQKLVDFFTVLVITQLSRWLWVIKMFRNRLSTWWLS